MSVRRTPECQEKEVEVSTVTVQITEGTNLREDGEEGNNIEILSGIPEGEDKNSRGHYLTRVDVLGRLLVN